MDLAEAGARGFAPMPRHPWERARLALVSRLIRQHAPPADDDVVIDVGCGDTFVVESLARRYARTRFFAVDNAFTPELIAAFRQRITAQNVTLLSSLDDVPRDRPASLILLMDVLEHVSDDRAMLRALTEDAVTGPGTRFLVTVPAYPMLFSSHDRFLGHFRRYTGAAFDGLLAGAGLVPVIVGRIFTTLLPLRVARVVAERLGHGDAPAASELTAWRGSETMAQTLAWVLEWDGRVALALLALGIRVPGLSHVAICRTSV
jgi:hypothetical protein